VKLADGYVTVIVRPSMRGKMHPLTAYIAGTQIEGCGKTVLGAIEDLFTSAKAGKVCAPLERAVAMMGEEFIMALWCSRCHTEWIERVLNVGDKCPFKDCDGWLSGQRPHQSKVAPKKQKPTFPLLDDANGKP
jgi:hypothetical protein